VDPALITLEVTETELIRDTERAQTSIRALRERGLRVVVDDYGAGHAALGYLYDFHLDGIKIDKRYVKDILNSERAHAIVQSTIQMAHSLGLKVVAEGVEDAQTLQELGRLGCDRAQGYHYARPMPLHELQIWLNHQEAA
jgi:EAL domain-containing protein (putative c-di-GMP-specific phosphodiesterase class I)